jgi:hypothetical protein
MANLGNTFNADNVEPLGKFEPVPVGSYKAAMVESEFKLTKAGTGRYLNCKWEIVEGEYKGRNVWSRLNLENPNQTAVDIAQRELSSICRAVGKMHVSDSSELHNIPCLIDVKVSQRDGYDPSNDIKDYQPLGGAAPTPVAAQPAQTPAQPQTETKKPWE